MGVARSSAINLIKVHFALSLQLGIRVDRYASVVTDGAASCKLASILFACICNIIQFFIAGATSVGRYIRTLYGT